MRRSGSTRRAFSRPCSRTRCSTPATSGSRAPSSGPAGAWWRSEATRAPGPALRLPQRRIEAGAPRVRKARRLPGRPRGGTPLHRQQVHGLHAPPRLPPHRGVRPVPAPVHAARLLGRRVQRTLRLPLRSLLRAGTVHQHGSSAAAGRADLLGAGLRLEPRLQHRPALQPAHLRVRAGPGLPGGIALRSGAGVQSRQRRLRVGLHGGHRGAGLRRARALYRRALRAMRQRRELRPGPRLRSGRGSVPRPLGLHDQSRLRGAQDVRPRHRHLRRVPPALHQQRELRRRRALRKPQRPLRSGRLPAGPHGPQRRCGARSAARAGNLSLAHALRGGRGLVQGLAALGRHGAGRRRRRSARLLRRTAPRRRRRARRGALRRAAHGRVDRFLLRARAHQRRQRPLRPAHPGRSRNGLRSQSARSASHRGAGAAASGGAELRLLRLSHRGDLVLAAAALGAGRGHHGLARSHRGRRARLRALRFRRRHRAGPGLRARRRRARPRRDVLPARRRRRSCGAQPLRPDGEVHSAMRVLAALLVLCACGKTAAGPADSGNPAFDAGQTGGDGGSGDGGASTPPQVKVKAIFPGAGTTPGGGTAMVTGSGFVEGFALRGGADVSRVTTVSIGGAAGTNLEVIDDNRLELTLPAGAPGAADVSVTNPNGTGTCAGCFRYVAPVKIASVQPATGPSAGGTPVTVHGDGFTSDLLLTFDGRELISFQIKDAQTATGTAPPGAPGGADVLAVTRDGRGELRRGYIYADAVRVDAVTPPAVPTAGTRIVISGAGFGPLAPVKIDGAAALSAWVDDAHLDLYAPAHAAGAVDVSVDGATLVHGLVYADPGALALYAVQPARGPVTGGISLHVLGSGLSGATVLVAGVPATAHPVSDVQVDVDLPPGAAPGLADVTVQASGVSQVLAGAFWYDPAFSISAIAPGEGP